MTTLDLGLEALAERVEHLGKAVPRAAKAAGPALLAVVRAQQSAGAGPDGEAWELRKADGGIALQSITAGTAIKVTGTRLILQLNNWLRIHQVGVMPGGGRSRRSTRPAREFRRASAAHAAGAASPTDLEILKSGKGKHNGQSLPARRTEPAAGAPFPAAWRKPIEAAIETEVASAMGAA